MKLERSTWSEAFSALDAALAAVLLAAAFGVNGAPGAALVGLVPLWGMARVAPEARAVRFGAASAFAFWAVTLRWLTNVTVLGWLGLSAYCALLVMPSVLFANRWKGGPMGFALGLAGIWWGMETFRGWFGGGFPWNPLAAAMVPWNWTIQPAEWVGAGGVSALVAFVNALIAWPLTGGRHRRAMEEWWRGEVPVEEPHPLALVRSRGRGAFVMRRVSVFVMVVFALQAVIHLRLTALLLADAETARPVTVAMIQPSIPQDEKWVSSKVDMIYSRLATLTRQAIAGPAPAPDAVLWPETAVPDDLLTSKRSMALASSLCRARGTPLVTGTLDTVLDEAAGTVAYYNAAALLDAQGRPAASYAKRHLVVMGEFVPLSRFIPAAWRRALGIPPDITPGTAGGRFPLGPRGAEVPAAPLICFEDLVASLARRDVADGARLLVNLTNDAWFDDALAPMQHMRAAALRAVENRVPLLRAANTGVTCAIDRTGRVTALLRDGATGRTADAGVLRATVLAPPDGMRLTFYTRFGNIGGVPCAAATALWLIAGWFRNRRKGILPQNATTKD
ncbi:MAG: apolipoprotein N-acyltransferase [Kiritimatiellae bacterium]|nr:apolipoprotein N-acyltransferase [Kiritimatiellia bacterium]